MWPSYGRISSRLASALGYIVGHVRMRWTRTPALNSLGLDHRSLGHCWYRSHHWLWLLLNRSPQWLGSLLFYIDAITHDFGHRSNMAGKSSPNDMMMSSIMTPALKVPHSLGHRAMLRPRVHVYGPRGHARAKEPCPGHGVIPGAPLQVQEYIRAYRIFVGSLLPKIIVLI